MKFFENFIAKISLCIIFCITNQCKTFAQCFLNNPFPLESTSSSLDCSNSINYAPNIPSHTPIKYIRIDIHVFQKDDGTGNFQNLPVDIDFLMQTIGQVNAWNRSLAILTHGTSPYIKDSRIILTQPQIYFHPHTEDWTWGVNPRNKADALYDKYIINDFDNLGLTFEQKYETLHIFLQGDSPTPIGGEVSWFGDKNWIREKGWYETFLNDPSKYWATASNLRHEFGHSCGLYHNFQGGPNGNQCDDCVDNDDFTNCPLEGSSNNEMDYFPSAQNALSECQLGKMHFYLSGKAGNISDCVVKDYCTFSVSEVITINNGESIVWNSDKKTKGNLLINSQGSLTIKCKVSIPEFGKIIIEPGGRLIVDGSIITNSCGNMWQGIEVWGDATKSQLPFNNSSQGILILNNAVIENARNAVALQRSDAWGYQGGIVQATNTIFRNNRRDAEFLSYRNFHPSNPNITLNNLSFFTNCTFETNSALLDPAYNYQGRSISSPSLVSMWQVRGVKFTNCIFKANAAVFDPDVRGTGILTIDAGYTVSGNQTLFEGFTEAVSSISSTGGITSINITDATFRNNIRGIVFDGVQSSLIAKNIFEVPRSLMFSNPSPLNPGVNKPLGIYLTNSSGYKIEENTFTSFGSPATPGEQPQFYDYGVVSNDTKDNSGAVAGNIYRNNFLNTIVGTQAEQDNKGLQIKCNTYQNIAEYDWSLTGKLTPSGQKISGELRDQGYCSNGTTPAGNQYLDPCSGESQIRVGLFGQPFIYSSHSNLLPTCKSNAVSIINCNIMSGPSSCPSTLTSPCNPACNLGNINAINTSISNLQAQIDGNSTQSLLVLIYSDAVSGFVESTLLSATPLSDTVMLVAFVHRTIPLPDNSVKNIAIANSPLTSVVLEALHNRIPALTVSIMQEIDNAQTGISQRKQIEDLVLNLKIELGLTENELIRQYLEIDSTGIDSVIAYLTGKNDESSKKKLIQTYLLSGNCSAAQTLLNQITSNNSENTDFAAFYNILLNVCQTRNSVFDITPAEEQTIRTIALHTTTTSSNARNTLSLVFGDVIPRVPLNVEPVPGVLQPCSGTEVPNYYSNLTIGSGQTYYVAQGMTYTKNVTITSSTGVFCNNGTFTGKVIFQQGGTFNNIATTNSSLTWVMSSGGTINNGFGSTMQAASLSVSGGTAVINNYALLTVTGSLSSSNPGFSLNNFSSGTLNNGSVSSWSSGNLINDGTINVTGSFNRSGGTFSNKGQTVVSGNFSSSAGGFTNDSTLSVTGNFSSSGSAINNCTITTSGDFTTSASFINNARISITKKFTNSGNPFTMGSGALVSCKDFTNSGGVINSTGGCGRFNIIGTSINSATISSGIDICDGTPPANSPFIDINSGTISPSVTWCVCTASGQCIGGSNKKENKERQAQTTSSVKQDDIILYPNPNEGEFSLSVNLEGKTQIVIYDLAGRIIYEMTFDNRKELYTEIDLKDKSKGIYFIRITVSDGNTITEKIIYK